MSVDLEVNAIRTSCALSTMNHAVYLRISGADAYAAADRIFPTTLRLRDAQILLTLLLKENGRLLADVQLGREDDNFLVVIEGLPPDEAIALLRDRMPSGAQVDIEDIGESHEVLALNGPYAWEVMSALAGPEIVGMPYGTLFRVRGWTCFRAGKTGEYGYELFIPKQEAPAVREQILEIGSRFELQEASLQALDRCALENWFLNVRREGREDLTPLELQLQWRISYEKDYVGVEALRKRRADGIRRRIACLIGDTPVEAGMDLWFGDSPVGYVVNAEFSNVRKQWVAHGLLDTRLSRPGIQGFSVGEPASAPSFCTVLAPVINNRSLYVNPQRHHFRTRDGMAFPELVV
jgi:glycine cleavage system aminomethyltransferase T